MFCPAFKIHTNTSTKTDFVVTDHRQRLLWSIIDVTYSNYYRYQPGYFDNLSSHAPDRQLHFPRCFILTYFFLCGDFWIKYFMGKLILLLNESSFNQAWKLFCLLKLCELIVTHIRYCRPKWSKSYIAFVTIELYRYNKFVTTFYVVSYLALKVNAIVMQTSAAFSGKSTVDFAILIDFCSWFLFSNTRHCCWLGIHIFERSLENLKDKLSHQFSKM